MAEFTTVQIAARCNKSERTIQRWIQKGTLKAEHIEGNRYEVNEDDLQPFLPHALVEGLSLRIDALESRVSELEGIIRGMSSKPPMRHVIPPRPVYEHSAVSEGKGTLPEGLVSIVDLIKQYNAPETSVMRNMRPYLKTGPWKTSDGRVVKYALDAEGQAEFTRRYGQ